ncbi:erythromycin esterase family protein [Nonomuraea sp. MTCD27]|uniref:erythromycin esterase family protein n=1 Tax=Nonomuraea sp. MTCD27 TaxID=1676747 RepID=UPI0035BF0648
MAADPSVRESVVGAARDLDGEGVSAVTAFVRSLPAPPRLLGLGEAMHGEEAYLELRNAIFREFVEHAGFRSFALESDCMAGLAVDAYVTEGSGTLDDVMERGFSHGAGEFKGNRELVRWMRAYNEDRPAADRLRFFGFDGPLEMTVAATPRQALTTLHGYLARHGVPLPCSPDTLDRLVGDDARWTDPAAAMDPSRSVGRSPDVAELRLLTDDLVALLTAHAPHLIPATSPDEWWRASLCGRTAAGLLRYHAGMADTSADRVWRLMALRDAMMADNLLALAPYGPTLVNAHNRHLQREKSTWQLADMALDWWSAGSIAGARLGDGYAFLASALGSVRHQGLPTPHPDTVEGILSTLPGDRYLVDPRALAESLGDHQPSPRTDIAWNYGYFPLSPGHLTDIDGIVFVKDVAQRPEDG